MNDDYSTPANLRASLDAEFHFTDDPCPLGGIALGDGLLREWGLSTFVNPPYSKPGPWCEKAVLEAKKGKLIVMLLKCDTSTSWFHKWVFPFAELRFIRGRLHFPPSNGSAPFPSLIAIFRPGRL